MLLRHPEIIDQHVEIGILVLGVGLAQLHAHRSLTLELLALVEVELVVTPFSLLLQHHEFLVSGRDGALEFRAGAGQVLTS